MKLLREVISKKQTIDKVLDYKDTYGTARGIFRRKDQKDQIPTGLKIPNMKLTKDREAKIYSPEMANKIYNAPIKNVPLHSIVTHQTHVSAKKVIDKINKGTGKQNSPRFPLAFKLKSGHHVIVDGLHRAFRRIMGGYTHMRARVAELDEAKKIISKEKAIQRIDVVQKASDPDMPGLIKTGIKTPNVKLRDPKNPKGPEQHQRVLDRVFATTARRLSQKEEGSGKFPITRIPIDSIVSGQSVVFSHILKAKIARAWKEHKPRFPIFIRLASGKHVQVEGNHRTQARAWRNMTHVRGHVIDYDEVKEELLNSSVKESLLEARTLKPDEIEAWKKHIADGKSAKEIGRATGYRHQTVANMITGNKTALGLDSKPKGKKRPRNTARNNVILATQEKFRNIHRDYTLKTADELGHTEKLVREVIRKTNKKKKQQPTNEARNFSDEEVKKWKGYIKDGLSGKEIAKKEGLSHGTARVYLALHRDRLGLKPKTRRPINTKRDAEVENRFNRYREMKSPMLSTKKRVLHDKIANQMGLTTWQVKRSLGKRKKARKALVKNIEDNLSEAIGDVYRELGRHIKTNIHSSTAYKFAHAMSYQDFNHAAEIYKGISPKHPHNLKGELDGAMKKYSHHYDIHSLFHDHIKEMDRKKAVEAGKSLLGKKLDLSAQRGSKEHFLHLAARYRQLGLDKDNLGGTAHAHTLRSLHHELESFRHKFKYKDDPDEVHLWKHMKNIMVDSTHDQSKHTEIWEQNFGEKN
jgi:DNA-binding CsgD family transcriptional regulator